MHIIVSNIDTVLLKATTTNMTNAEQVFRKLVDQIAVEQGLDNYEVTIQRISSGGANFTTQLFLATVKGYKELRLFGKFGTMPEKLRSSVPNSAFEAEHFFYTKLAKIYQGIENKYKLPDKHKLGMPKFYASNPKYLEETIVLENLIHQGYKDSDRFSSVDWPYAASAVEQMAKFHALSHAFKKQNPLEFNKVVDKTKFKWEMSEEQRDKFWTHAVNQAIKVAAPENRERVEKHLHKANLSALEELNEPIDTTVLIHSNYRLSNLLHKRNKDGTVSIKIVDFQTIQGGCPTMDLLYFMITGTDEEFRRQYFQQLVDHYYEQLCAALLRIGLKPDEIYPRKMYDKELKAKLQYALKLAALILPLVTVEEENAPAVQDKDADLSSLSVKKTSQIYEERLNGVINDCIRWGII